MEETQDLLFDLDNKEQQQALQVIQFTRSSLFLTGKAGTGKSTFLRNLTATTKKKHIVLAPTGIAAINVGGTTLHSFFKLPFHPLLPNDIKYSRRNIRETLKYNSEKAKIIREVELIIIDEVSMVRADIIDFIDKVLRIYTRNHREPFGGKQMLFVGDVYQLEPVVKENDKQLLHNHYHSFFFFNAQVFQNFQLISIELTKNYRQRDQHFISLLDRIRTSAITSQDLLTINSRYGVPHSSSSSDFTITLCARRDTVEYINDKALNEIAGDPTTLYGIIEGEFSENSLPAPSKLELKPGAQVLFVKNDKDRRWVNGTIGVVMDIHIEDGGYILVKTDDGRDVAVEQERWSNIVYSFNTDLQKIEEKEIGTYTQFPLQLAWAITIHKSQGLTFKNINIDIGSGVFAGGQTYVALSRCTTLEGITLLHPIKQGDIFVNAEITRFAKSFNNPQHIQSALNASKADKAYHDAVSAFDKGNMEDALSHFFIAIHSRYDIEKPAAKRLIRRKLNLINTLKNEIETLHKEQEQQRKFLRKLAKEYVQMGMECEQENMISAAIKNYQKALKLDPNSKSIAKKIKQLSKQI